MSKIVFLTLFLFVASSNAGVITTDFIVNNEVTLAQFITDNGISTDELLHLDITLATLIDYADPNNSKNRSLIQFYIIYRPGQKDALPRYYYFIDPKMKNSKLVTDPDRGIIDLDFLPPHLVENENNRIANFGKIDPTEIVNSSFFLKTDNGYEIEITRYGFHVPGEDILGDLGNETKTNKYLRTTYPHWYEDASVLPFETEFFVTGNIKATDQLTAEQRSNYITQQSILAAKLKATVLFREAVNRVITRANGYADRFNANQSKLACKSTLSEIMYKANQDGSKH